MLPVLRKREPGLGRSACPGRMLLLSPGAGSGTREPGKAYFDAAAGAFDRPQT